MTKRQWMMLSIVFMSVAWIPFVFVIPHQRVDTPKLLAALPAPYSTGDIAHGKALVGQCTLCHSLPKGGPKLSGPNLYDLLGRRAASVPDFAYSSALKAGSFTWDAPRLDRWIADPKTDVPGTTMAYPGLMSPKDRVDLIAYLKVATSPEL